MLRVRASVRAPGRKHNSPQMVGMKTNGRNSYRGAGQAPEGSQGLTTMGNQCILRAEGQREEVELPEPSEIWNWKGAVQQEL